MLRNAHDYLDSALHHLLYDHPLHIGALADTLQVLPDPDKGIFHFVPCAAIKDHALNIGLV